MRREQEEGISGGRFVPAASYLLPPTRSYRLQAGRFVRPELLPPEQVIHPGLPNYRGPGYPVMIDWANAYHFGDKVSARLRREE